MTDPNQIVPKLLDIKHQDQVRRLSAVMSQIRVIESKQAELEQERARLDEDENGFARLSLQNGYGRYLKARSDALRAQKNELLGQVRALQRGLKETLCAQSILSGTSQT